MPYASRTRAAALLTTALLAAGALAACGGEEEGDVREQSLEWEDCPAPSDAQGGGTSPSPLPGDADWQCATMRAPLDWSEPDGETIGIELIRVRSSGGGKDRIGSLVFNFGGPGGSGITTLPAFGQEYEALRTRYDLVSFDPRGVGRSEPVECESASRLDALLQKDGTPDDAGERAEYERGLRDFNEACEENSGEVLPHVRTTDAARDLNLMREVLGDDKLYYFGISYGTELGGVYAHLFPEEVGRAVFDAVVDPTQDPEQGSLGQARGFQRALDNFAEDCASKPQEECPIGTDADDVKKRITQLLADLEERPLPGSFPRLLTETAATGGIAQALYSKDFWPLLTQALDEAYEGDGRTLLFLSDAMNGRDQSGEYSNLVAANTAINCSDDRPRYTVADVERVRPRFREASPVFGDYLAWSMLSCAGWPVAGAADHPDVGAPGAPPILVIGNTGDPATPYEGARRMARALGPGVGVEITYRGEGHGAYDSGDRCVQDAVNGYLLEGRAPRSGTVCG
ncbi:alpha/beta hydrolase [Streptomyces sp. MJP52]|uniref:alpha/beta hydrolase n=1 Tax=Streptomyces sp. MJP52 TaxID=2940555 RepID=UPI002473CA25|nr:alpha/beta hydrolase [Streptomyces sp. MJP52]MDH6225104.1 pimeloyl-ACP methyl ester carboxylesterase [Streptomyces sp. MJP52]